MSTPQRVQRRRTKGWRMPANTIYVGRGSRWGNPYRVGDTNSFGRTITCPDEAVDTYRDQLEDVLGTNANMLIFALLQGKNLACWCPLDEPCHADVLLDFFAPYPELETP